MEYLLPVLGEFFNGDFSSLSSPPPGEQHFPLISLVSLLLNPSPSSFLCFFFLPVIPL